MKRILPILLLLAACGSSETEEQIKTEVESLPVNQETVSDGEFISKYDDGSVKLSGTIVNGQRSGTWTSYHRNGNKASENEYSNGLLNGKTLEVGFCAGGRGANEKNPQSVENNKKQRS